MLQNFSQHSDGPHPDREALNLIGAARLALGTVQFGLPYGVANTRGQVQYSEVAEMINIARAANIDTLDTAIAYGESESVLGKIGVSGFRVVSKIPALIPNSISGTADEWIISQVEASLERLGVSSLDGLMLHSPNDLMGEYGAKIALGMQKAKSSGLVKKIGLSVYHPDQLHQLTGLMPVEILQVPFNVFDRRFAQSGWLDRLFKSGVEVHARSAFLQGLLLMPRNSVPKKFSNYRKLIDEWHFWLTNHASERSPIQVCLDHVASYEGIARIVVGAENSSQLKEIISAASLAPEAAPPFFACDESPLINPSEWNSL